MRDADDRPTPRAVHPAFYGCFDWHSAVEMHWALVRMLRSVPGGGSGRTRSEAVLEEHLPPTPSRRGHVPAREPRVGAAVRLRLGSRPRGRAGSLGRRRERRPARTPAGGPTTCVRWPRWCPTRSSTGCRRRPTRSAAAPTRTAPSRLARSLPYARLRSGRGRPGLLTAIANAAVRWFAADVDYPAAWEPNGADFLSPALAEAEFIAALASPPEEFPEWLTRFLPHLADGRPESLLTPAVVTDPTDGQGAHLHGLNLYRAYGFGLLAATACARGPAGGRPAGRARAARRGVAAGRRRRGLDGRALAGLLRRSAAAPEPSRRRIVGASDEIRFPPALWTTGGHPQAGSGRPRRRRAIRPSVSRHDRPTPHSLAGPGPARPPNRVLLAIADPVADRAGGRRWRCSARCSPRRCGRRSQLRPARSGEGRARHVGPGHTTFVGYYRALVGGRWVKVYCVSPDKRTPSRIGLSTVSRLPSGTTVTRELAETLFAHGNASTAVQAAAVSQALNYEIGNRAAVAPAGGTWAAPCKPWPCATSPRPGARPARTNWLCTWAPRRFPASSAGPPSPCARRVAAGRRPSG